MSDTSGADEGVARRLRGLRRPRKDSTDDEGPFFAPEPSPTPRTDTDTGTGTPAARPRPRPSTPPPSDPPPSTPPPSDPPPSDPPPSDEAVSRPRPRPGPGRPAQSAGPAASAAPTRTEQAAASSTDAAPTVSTDKDSTEKDSTEKKKAPRRRPSFRGVLRASKLRRRIVKLVIVVAVVVAAALALRTYVVAPYYIPSQSMEPTLHGCPGCDDDHVLVDKLSYRFHDPHAGDIVVFDTPPSISEPDPVLIKRVIGVGGELLVLKHGSVFVNGKRISEPYFKYGQNCPGEKRVTEPETRKSRWQIPENDVFVMGDNRCDSTDSRTFGPIPDSSIVGRAFVIVWPLQRFSFL